MGSCVWPLRVSDRTQGDQPWLNGPPKALLTINRGQGQGRAIGRSLPSDRRRGMSRRA